MKLKQYREGYELFSGKVSDISRNLCFVGFGVIWILTGDLQQFTKGDEARILMWAMLLFSLSLLFDLSQYIYQTSMNFYFMRKYEKADDVDSDKDYRHRAKYNKPANCFFRLKVLLMIFSYGLIIIHILQVIIYYNP